MADLVSALSAERFIKDEAILCTRTVITVMDQSYKAVLTRSSLNLIQDVLHPSHSGTGSAHDEDNPEKIGHLSRPSSCRELRVPVQICGHDPQVGWNSYEILLVVSTKLDKIMNLCPEIPIGDAAIRLLEGGDWV